MVAIQSSSKLATATQIQALQKHEAFILNNPNRARSLIFQFCVNNSQGLHAKDGSGYQFWADNVIALNAINPEIAARLARAFDQWSRYTPDVRNKMKAALEYVSKQASLSSNVAEIISKALSIS